ALPPGHRLCLPVALRGVRAAAARGDGQRYARGHVERVVAAGGGGRRGHPGRPRGRQRHRARAAPGAARPGAAGADARARTGARRGVLLAADGGDDSPDLRRGGHPAPMSMGAGGAGTPWRVALVHDWLTGMRGGERVLEVLCRMYPEATLHTLVHVPGSVSADIERLKPRTSILQRVPNVARWYRHLLPLYPAALPTIDV